MARITKETRDTIIAAFNDYLVSIGDKEEIDIEFNLTDDGVDNKITFNCVKPSKSGGMKRKLEYKDGLIHVDMN